MSGEVVRLSLPTLPCTTPECSLAGDVCRWDLLVPISPEPAIDVDRLQGRGITAFIQEITLPTRSVEIGDIV